MVIGSQIPWIEAILLEKGVNHVTTLDYASIENHHPNISVITPNTLDEMYLNKTFHGQNLFDAVATFSSLEHSGLGRYTTRKLIRIIVILSLIHIKYLIFDKSNTIL